MQTTSDRLKYLMNERKLKQVDILEMVKPYCEKYKIKMGKSDLSQFVNGKVNPGQSKLSILGMALDVSEAWLMGLDVPMERMDQAASPDASISVSLDLTADEQELLDLYRDFNEEGQQKLMDYAADLSRAGIYKNNNKSRLVSG